MMQQQWVANIRVRCASLVLVLASTGYGQVAQLAAGADEYRKHAYSAAAARLEPLPAKLPQLADYSAFYLGASQFELKQWSASLAALQKVYQHVPVSPLSAKAIVMAAQAHIEAGRPTDALALLRQYSQKVGQPQADSALARAYDAAGDGVSAAVHFQKVYYAYPTSAEAGEAEIALRRLRTSLRDSFPPPMAQAILTRAKGFADGRRYIDARRELEENLGSLGGADQDVARVRMGALSFQSRDYAGCYKYLKTLAVATPEADAERLHYLVWCARRLDYDDAMAVHLRELDLKHPVSTWRLEAQLAAAELYLNRNEQELYEPIYRTCSEAFADRPQASFCHWKITWANYLRNQSDAENLFKNHLRQFPTSEKVPASLYFLGRFAESGRDFGSSKAYYSEIDARYPNHYYAMLARERLKDALVAGATPTSGAHEFLRGIAFVENRRTANFEASAVTRQRLERARLLESGGLVDWAEQELRFAARADGQPQVVALELARILEKRGATDEALRAVKAYVPNYLSIPWEGAPETFWRVAFPLPYRESLVRNSKTKELDPWLVAGLIRQESEFNPKAVSVSRALGLTQVMPATGRELSRRIGMRKFSSSMLFEPELNLKLGTVYLSQLLNSLNGKWEHALASYNGGRSRVMRWMEWGKYREPAEFVETIPFRETRDYVQIVMRNASVYRKLYANTLAAVAVPTVAVPAVAAVRHPVAKRKATSTLARRKAR